MDLTPLSVHHHRNSEALLLIEPAHSADDRAMPVAVTMAHINSRNVHPTDSKGLKLLRLASSGSNRANKLRSPRAPEPIFLELGFRDSIDIDGSRGDSGDTSVVGDEVSGRRSSGSGEDRDGAAAGEKEGERWGANKWGGGEELGKGSGWG